MNAGAIVPAEPLAIILIKKALQRLLLLLLLSQKDIRRRT
jgi:hypothetical protein